MKTNPRYVELVRVSTQGQADRDTPKDQRASLDKLRIDRPGVLVDRIDEAISGAKSNESRSDIQRLFELASAKAFDEVRVRHIDRLTRHGDPRERFAIYGAIQDAGAVIVEASGRVIDPADEMGELDLTLQGWFAARERKRILDRTSAAKYRKAREGRLVQGQRPFGRTFDKFTGEWGIDKVQAKAYRRMFDLCLAGQSLNEIAATLNKSGSVTPRGCAWSGGNVSRLLRDEAAFGSYTAQGHTFQIPAIVNEDTFRAALAKSRSNNSNSGPKPTAAVFALVRKIATCGVCGSLLYTQRGGGASRILYYTCSAYDPACRVHHRVSDIDAAVIKRLEGWLDHPDTLGTAASSAAPRSVEDEARREIEEVVTELRRLDKQEVNTARLVTRGAIKQKVGLGLLAEVAANRTDAEARLAAAKARLDDTRQEAERVEDAQTAVARLRESLRTRTPQRWRELVEVVFRKGGIAVHPDGAIELVGRLPVGVPLRKSPRASGRR